jgi:RNA polymerase sigma-70 factor (ECF subfamily)
LVYGNQQRFHLTANFLSLATEKHLDKSDQELLELFYRDKNNEWLGILLSRYTLLLFGLCMKYLKSEDDAKDAVQQVFIKVIHELPKYKVTYFKSWLYMVGKNHCLLELRGRKKSHFEINDNLLSADANDLNLQSLLQKEQTLNLLEQSITTLNEEQKLCITLFYLQKKSYLEITTATGFTLMQVKSHIQNGKRNLKIMLEKQLEHGA